MPIVKNISIDQLRAFIMIVDHGTFREAAYHINRTQSAVSQQIKQLEEHLGIELFGREGRRKVLTEGGKTIYTIATNVVQANDLLVSHAELLRNQLAHVAQDEVTQ